MKTNNKTWLTPALRLIKKHAPNTYEAMINADWKVHAVASEQDLLKVAGHLHPWVLAELVQDFSRGLACTVAKTEDAPSWARVEDSPLGSLNHTSLFNLHNLRSQAYHGGVDLVCLTAQVLVHEWWHRRGYGERKAYDAGTEFAVKMGQPRIARLSEHTKARVVA